MARQKRLNAMLWGVFVTLILVLGCLGSSSEEDPLWLIPAQWIEATHIDTDWDGIPDPADNCVNHYNPEQIDTDDDGVGQACDNCVFIQNMNQEDTDNNGIGDECEMVASQNPDDFPNCLPVIEDHNGEVEQRVNWVFVGYQFETLEKMRKIFRDAVTLDESSYWSLMNVEPFKSNQDKINIWYVNKQGDYRDLEGIIRIDNPQILPDSLLFECPQFTNQHVVIFQDSDDWFHMLETILHSCAYGDCINTTGGAYMQRGYIWMFSKFPFIEEHLREEGSRHYLAHEWGHIFGQLPDHYINDAYGDRYSSTALPPEEVCRNWCEEEYKTYHEIMEYRCRDYITEAECNKGKLAFQPCYWHLNECINIAAHCALLETQGECLQAPFCGYIRNISSSEWHTHHCVAVNTGMTINDVVENDRYDRYVQASYPIIDVGLNCEAGTGCFNCGSRDIGAFRADAFTLMRHDFSNTYGHYENKAVESIIDRIINGEYYTGFWEYHGKYASTRP